VTLVENKKIMTELVWFRNDLRLHDHAPLTAAVASGKPVLAFYCFDDRDFDPLGIGVSKTGPYRSKILYEAVATLHQQLSTLGVAFLVVRSRTEEALQTIIQKFEVQTIHATFYPTPEETQRSAAVAALGVPLKLYDGHSLILPEDLPFNYYQLPKVFTAFRKKVEARLMVRPPLPAPTKILSAQAPEVLPTPEDLCLNFKMPDERTAFPFAGGEIAGLDRLEAYLWETGLIDTYKASRNGLMGADYSSKFSVYLAHGALSPRKIYSELRAYETQNGANEGTYWLFFELLWRDFFYFQAAAQGGAFFKYAEKKVTVASKALQFWMEGRTRDPFVDAAMRELAATGYTSNRMRQNVASYLIHNLKGDWVAGAAYFESLLIDYDCTSNYGNWTYLAGSGNDPRDNRVFNTKRQADMYDPDGSYQEYWRH
jgi:deoxyribodipyrimidine photo-lyase